MLYSDGVLVLEPTRIRDALGVIDLTDLPDVQPRHPARATNSTPLIERLWRIALSDVERNIVELPDGAYFDSGASFSHIVFTRDIAYSGVLGLNRLFPDIMLLSLRHTRKLRLELGYLLSRGHELQGFGIDYEVEDIPYPEFLKKYGTNCYTRRTDDVVWLWAGEDLLRYSGTGEQWRWLYEMGKHCQRVTRRIGWSLIAFGLSPPRPTACTIVARRRWRKQRRRQVCVKKQMAGVGGRKS